MSRATADPSNAKISGHFCPPRGNNRADDVRCLFSSSSPEFLGDLWIAEIILVQIKQMQTQAMFHFAHAQIVQISPPLANFDQIFRDVGRQKNVSGIAAIQHPLGDIDSRARDIRLLVNVYDAIHRTTMNPHAQLDPRTTLQGSADFERAPHRFFRT